MSAAHPTPAAPTAEQLRMAWPFFCGRRGCPDTLEAAVAHRYYGPCIRALARQLHRVPLSAFNAGGLGAAAAAAARLGRETYVPPTPPSRPLPPGKDQADLARWKRPTTVPVPPHLHRARVGAHDAKRAAANDIDDAADAGINTRAA